MFQFSQQLRLARRWAGGRRGRVGHYVVLVLAGVGGGVKGLANAAEVDEFLIQLVAGQDAGIGGAAPGGFGVLLVAQAGQKLGTGGG